MAALEKKIARSQKKPDIQEMKDSLHEQKVELWFSEREWYAARTSIPEGPFLRGMEITRSDPAWYMNEILVQDFADRGHCCGRDCGCCLSRVSPLKGKLSAGHCTVKCFCCEESRGFELAHHGEKELMKRFELGPDTDYSYRMVLGSLQGLGLGPDEAIDVKSIEEFSSTKTEVAESWEECEAG